MKNFKMFLSAMMLALVLMVTPVMANGFGAQFDIDSSVNGGAIDYDYDLIPGGVAGGIGGATGNANAGAGGGIFYGSVGGDVDTIGGGVTNTQAYVFSPGVGDVSIGVGSASQSMAVTGAEANIYVSGFLGGAGTEISGFAAQGTLNGSYLDETSVNFANSEGFTGGIAGQGSIGGFSGGAFVETFIGSANATIGANIEMTGMSYSDSYAFTASANGVTTEGMGTFVGANTEIETSGYANNDSNWCADGYSYVGGGYSVIGGAGAITVQESDNGSAYASTVGVYTGSGGLNSSYSGSAVGYTNTSITTFAGSQGCIVHSSAGMHVSSEISPNQP